MLKHLKPFSDVVVAAAAFYLLSFTPLFIIMLINEFVL
jgi:hypothetical protein